MFLHHIGCINLNSFSFWNQLRSKLRGVFGSMANPAYGVSARNSWDFCLVAGKIPGEEKKMNSQSCVSESRVLRWNRFIEILCLHLLNLNVICNFWNPITLFIPLDAMLDDRKMRERNGANSGLYDSNLAFYTIFPSSIFSLWNVEKGRIYY